MLLKNILAAPNQVLETLTHQQLNCMNSTGVWIHHNCKLIIQHKLLNLGGTHIILKYKPPCTKSNHQSFWTDWNLQLKLPLQSIAQLQSFWPLIGVRKHKSIPFPPWSAEWSAQETLGIFTGTQFRKTNICGLTTWTDEILHFQN